MELPMATRGSHSVVVSKVCTFSIKEADRGRRCEITNRRIKIKMMTSSSMFTFSILLLPLLCFYAQVVSQQLARATGQPLQISTNQQHQHPDAPKLIPLSALERYQEGADLKLFCVASAPQSAGRIQFEWHKDNLDEPLMSGRHLVGSRQLHILMMDDASSVLRIAQLRAEDSGNYTCLARNEHGFDSSTVRVSVNVRLKWIREPPSELQVRAGKSIQLECDASGQPAPLISWSILKDQQTIRSKVLRIERVQVNDSGLYECRASSLQQSGNNDQLKKIVRLVVNGKYLIAHQ